MKVNNEITYETVYHFEDFPKEEIEFVEIFGGGTVSYTGFGDKGKMSQIIFGRRASTYFH